MKWHKHTLTIETRGKGLVAFTDQVNTLLRQLQVKQGMCFFYIPHCSASLVINENYDSTARRDMDAFLERVIPENQPWMQHTMEGSDDSSAHLRAMLTPVNLNIPVDEGRLTLGTWQGVFLAEHRSGWHQRQVYVRILDMSDPTA